MDCGHFRPAGRGAARHAEEPAAVVVPGCVCGGAGEALRAPDGPRRPSAPKSPTSRKGREKWGTGLYRGGSSRARARRTRFGPSRVILRQNNIFIFSYLRKLLWWFYGLRIG